MKRRTVGNVVNALHFHGRVFTTGAGRVVQDGPRIRFSLIGATSRGYSDAQIDDGPARSRRAYPWRPPLTLTVRARFSHPASALRGTAGFGFWNDPFRMAGARVPTLPRAVWFFYASPPAEMRLSVDVPGWGWKAMVLDALRPVALPLALTAPVLVLLFQVRALYRALWPPIGRALGVREALLPVEMARWHTYRLEWGLRETRFWVDDEPVLTGALSPRGPLSFVMWMDNQYLIATPQGRFRWGLLDVPEEQWMEVEGWEIVQ
ncbi:MAG: hypothetical protein RMK65_09345 [Anaerolineae bacterium]|nr:hypothetical protein [Anaerolineae bacterium]MDW7992312.1 hypothetical protein [Anaerolineae bacterium]